MTAEEKVNHLKELIKEKKSQIKFNEKMMKKGYKNAFYMKWNIELQFEAECYKESLKKLINQYS